MKLKWKTDLEKGVIVNNFDRRGWSKTNELSDWNIYWASVSTIKSIFNNEFNFRLNDMQILNHFPNHYELTRKDLMSKNIKRYLRDIQRDTSSTITIADFVPVTYNLPAEYNMFVEEFRRNPNSMWIMKPTSRSQGKGIFIVNKLNQIKKWSGNMNSQLSSSSSSSTNPVTNISNNTPLSSSSGVTQPIIPFSREAYIISRYLDSPLLIGGKKFDLRIYILVTSFKPLRVYQYCHGFARFCNVKYTTASNEIDNEFIHLTNVAIQKHNEDYNSSHGGKWHIHHLRLYIESTRGLSESNKLFSDIDQLIIHSLKSVQHIIQNDKHCFECYGYDILIDSALKPWLVEVNASPSLSTTTEADRIVKTELLRDIFNIMIPPSIIIRPGVPGLCGEHLGERPCKDTGGFYVLFDEALELGLYNAKDTSGTEDNDRNR